MPSIVDIIARAEEEAANIRKQGTESAREIVDAARESVRQANDAAREKAKQTFALRHEGSMRAARRLSADVYNVRAHETKSQIDFANTRYDAAVTYIVERVIRG